MNTIGITGGTGFVGQQLKTLLVSSGYRVIIFTTGKPPRQTEDLVCYAHWHPYKEAIDTAALSQINAMVHLAGAGIADKRWKKQRKIELEVSRLKEYATNCTTLISASATGFYGPDNGVKPFTESDPPCHDFLGHICSQWEAEAHKAGSFLRTVILRFGIVLGRESGAFPQLTQTIPFGIMPILGSGGQMVSWIEIHDLTRLILFALQHHQVRGIYNAVAPHAASHAQLMHTIAKTMGGFKLPVHVPSALLKILLGEMSTEVLKGCTVSAHKIMDAGFTFRHPELAGAVKAILGKQ